MGEHDVPPAILAIMHPRPRHRCGPASDAVARLRLRVRQLTSLQLIGYRQLKAGE